MKTVEIYWKDITAEKQQEILELLGDNGNYDVFPIAVIDYEDNKGELESLSDEEFNVLNKIANETGMDCWFSLRETNDGKTVVYILDDEFETTLKEGIDWLHQGIPSYEKCNLEKEEIEVFEELLKKLHIK